MSNNEKETSANYLVQDDKGKCYWEDYWGRVGYFNSEEVAVNYAIKLAKNNPKREYFVLKVIYKIETQIPIVVTTQQ